VLAEPAPGTTACLEDVDPGLAITTRRISRRRGLGILGAGASALVSGLASACGIIRLAPCSLNEPECCSLATCIQCDYEGTKDQYTCEEGYFPTYWSCIDSNGASWVCGECSWAQSASCFQGPFRCSIWY
jgi:hypothetical protein